MNTTAVPGFDEPDLLATVDAGGGGAAASLVLSCGALADLLERHRFRCGSEHELQDGIEHVLTGAGVAFGREMALSLPDRPDFLIAGGIALEVKTKGSLQDLLRQVSRYALHDSVKAVLCVGTPAWLSRVPGSLHGKQLVSVRLLSSLL